MSKKTVLAGILAIVLVFPLFDLAEQFYWSKEFGFQVKIPDDWQLSKGNNPNVVVRADHLERGCSFNVWTRKQTKPESINDYFPEKIRNLVAQIFREEISKTFSNVQIVDFGDSFLGKRRAGWLAFTCTKNTG